LVYNRNNNNPFSTLVTIEGEKILSAGHFSRTAQPAAPAIAGQGIDFTIFIVMARQMGAAA
jgi:hypothetical protein